MPECRTCWGIWTKESRAVLHLIKCDFSVSLHIAFEVFLYKFSSISYDSCMGVLLGGFSEPVLCDFCFLQIARH